LRLKQAARLQDVIRRLGKHRKGEENMVETIVKAEKMFGELVAGERPWFQASRGGYMLMGIAANKNAECRLREYEVNDGSTKAVLNMLQKSQPE
jgi:hypothetical protein